MITVDNVYRHFGRLKSDFTKEQQDIIESAVKAGINEYALRVIVYPNLTANKMRHISRFLLPPMDGDFRLAELEDRLYCSLHEYPDEAVKLMRRGLDAELPLPLLVKIFEDPSLNWRWVEVILDLYIRAKEEEKFHDKPLMDVVDRIWDYRPNLVVIYSLVGEHYEHLHVWDYDTMYFVLDYMKLQDMLNVNHLGKLIPELIRSGVPGGILLAALDSTDTDSFIRAYLRSEPMHRILLCQHPALEHVRLNLYKGPTQDEMSLEEICDTIDEAFERPKVLE